MKKLLLLSLLILGLGILCASSALTQQNVVNNAGDTRQDAVEVYIGNPSAAIDFTGLPFASTLRSAASQSIYRQSEMEGYTGLITHITYRYSHTGNASPNHYTVNVYMKMTTDNGFEDTSPIPWIPLETFKLVYTGTFPQLPVGTNDLVIELDEPFLYTGDNLLIAATQDSADMIFSTTMNLQATQSPVSELNSTLPVQANTALSATLTQILTANWFSGTRNRPNIKLTIVPQASDPVHNPPRNLREVSLSRDAVEMEWDAPEDGNTGTLTGYKVSRLSDGSPATFNVAANLLTFTDDISQILVFDDFAYEVQAEYDGEFFSAPSNKYEPNFLPILPVTISSFSATNVTEGVNISWTVESEIDLLGYAVYRADINYFNIARNISGDYILNHDFLDTNVVNGQNYYYWLLATDLNGAKEVFGPVNIVYTETEEETVKTFMSAAYPNPFSVGSIATFDVSVKANETADLKIFNIRGQIVQEFNGLTGGLHSLLWDGKDTKGREVSSGIYLYQLTSPSNQEVRRMVVLK